MRLSYADLLVGDLFLTLIGVADDDIGRAIVSALDLKGKLKMARSVAPIACHDESWLERLRKVLEKIESLGQDRNRYAHDVWAVTPAKEVVRLQFKVGKTQPRKGIPSKTTTLQETKMLPAEMYAKADAIDLAAIRIAALKSQFLEYQAKQKP